MPGPSVIKLRMKRDSFFVRGVTPRAIKLEMDTSPRSPRPGGHDSGMKLIRVLYALNFILFGAGLFAPSPWNYCIWVVSALVVLALEWFRPAGD